MNDPHCTTPTTSCRNGIVTTHVSEIAVGFDGHQPPPPRDPWGMAAKFARALYAEKPKGFDELFLEWSSRALTNLYPSGNAKIDASALWALRQRLEANA